MIVNDKKLLTMRINEINVDLLNMTCTLEIGGFRVFKVRSNRLCTVLNLTAFFQVTALWLACWLKHWALANLLAELNANPNLYAVNEGGGVTSPLYLALKRGSQTIDTITILLQKSALLDVTESLSKLNLKPKVLALLERTGDV